MGRWVIMLLGQHYLFYGIIGYTVDRTALPVLWDSGLHCKDMTTLPGLSDSVLHCRQDNITWFMGRWEEHIDGYQCFLQGSQTRLVQGL